MGASLCCLSAAVEYLGMRGYDPAFGARPVKRVVQQELETALAKAILRGELAEVGAVCVAVAVNGVAPAAAAGATTAAAAS